MRVKDLMSTRVSSVTANEPASRALRAMWDCDCGAIPVLSEDGRVVAMVTDRDVAMTSLHRDQPPSALRVSDAMSKDLQFCSPDDPVNAAEDIMRAHQVRRLPVLSQDRRLVGVLSTADILRAAGHRERRFETAPQDAAATMAIICTPRARPEARV